MSRENALETKRRFAFRPHALVLAALLAPSPAIAQSEPALVYPQRRPPEPPPRLNAIQLDLGAAVVGGAYERVFGEHFALQFEGHLFGTWFFPFFGLPNFTGGGIQVRPTFFFLQRAPAGLYVAPFVRAEYVTAQDPSGVTGGGAGFSAGTWVGYSGVIARFINVRAGVGAQYMYYRVDTPTARVEYNGAFPALDLVVGWMF